ncbi:MAG: hypothetical protein ACI4HQ_11185 [Acetatifactor sp.]
METFLVEDRYHVPKECTKCGGVMIFKGVGEYHCEDCGEVAYDDYGKVRLYIEGHPGATAAEIEENIGVSQRTIRYMLKEGRLEVTADSVAFLRCEACGKNIRSGTYCTECEILMHRKFEEKQRERLHKSMHLIGTDKLNGEGQRRFRRDG